MFTLISFVTLLSLGASAQKQYNNEGGHANNDRYSSYYGGFKEGYGHNWRNEGYGRFDHDDRFHMSDFHERLSRHEKYMRFRNGAYFNDWDANHLHAGQRLLFQLSLGRRDRF